MSLRRASLAGSVILASLSALHAQSTLVDWNHTWNYMHPTTGALPAGSGLTTPHRDGATEWYAEQATFETSYRGPSFTVARAGFEAGAGIGPFGYGACEYMTTPQPAPGEFTAFGTTLATPASGRRYTAYFRTTFTVPDDGEVYDAPIIRFLFDDGGFVYLDGVLILEANITAGLNDDYLTLAANTTSTESHIREAELDLPTGSLTGGNAVVVPALAGNATVVTSVPNLAPGVHTLAVALHNVGTGSSDITMALQLNAGQAACVLDATVSNVTRDLNNTPNHPSDDIIAVTLNVVPTGIFGAGWKVSGPAGSSVLGEGGNYNEDITITDIAFADFAGGGLSLELQDADDPFCTTTVGIFPPRIIGTDNRTGEGLPIMTDGASSTPGWVINDALRTMTMNNAGGGAAQVITSEVIDLTRTGEVFFSGVLQVDDSSSGTEADDTFLALLIIDGDSDNPINLITPHDTFRDGILSDDELAPAAGSFNYDLSYTIPSSADSVQIVIEGINNSPNETFLVRDLLLDRAAVAGLKLFFDIEAQGNNLVLTWASGAGQLYNVRSEATLNGTPLDWPIVGGQESLVATPPFNTITIPRPAEAEHFFVIEAFPAPPDSVFTDDLETGATGWTMGSDGDPGTAWELGTPSNGVFAANSPANCFGANLHASYDANANVWLRSPAIDLTGVATATLKYAQFYDIEEPDPSTGEIYDWGQLAVLDASDDSVLAVIEPALTDFVVDWEQVSKAVPAAALGKQVKFEFRLQTDDVAFLPGWYIDDVEVTVP